MGGWCRCYMSLANDNLRMQAPFHRLSINSDYSHYLRVELLHDSEGRNGYDSYFLLLNENVHDNQD